MQLFKSLAILSALLTAAAAIAVDYAQEQEMSLEERAVALTKCPKGNGCKCRKGTKQGQYCAACAAVTSYGSGGSFSHVYECNKDGGCCDYGYAKDCAGEEPYFRCGKDKLVWD